MGLGFSKRKVFVGIKDGKVFRKTENGSESFDYIEGKPAELRVRSVELKFGETRMLELDLADPQDGETYCLGLSLQGSVARSILNCLDSMPGGFGLIHIRPYKNKAGFNAVFVANDGAKLSWAQQVPERKVDKGGHFDDSEREAFTEALAARVAEKIRSSRPGQAVDDDIPF